MIDIRGREVRFQAVVNCGECMNCHFDQVDECFRCHRHLGEPKVDPIGELPEWCFLLRDADILSHFMTDEEAEEAIKKNDEKTMELMERYKELECEKNE